MEIATSWVDVVRDVRSRRVGDRSDDVWTSLRQKLRTTPPIGFEVDLLGRFLKSDPPGGIPAIRIAIASDSTSEPLANAARVALLSEGYRAEVYEAPFD